MDLKLLLLLSALSISTNFDYAMRREEPAKNILQPKWGFSVRQGRRPSMEDTHVAFYPFADNNRWAFFGVYDGHGGVDAAQATAKMLHEYLMNELLKNPTASRGTLIEKAFSKTETYILVEKSILSGTTATIAFLEEFILRLAWVGDTRALVLRGPNIIAKTKDHKPDDSIEKARIEKAGGKIKYEGVPRVRGLALSRSLGDREVKISVFGGVIETPEIERIIVQDNDILIIACDGLWDVFSNEEAAKLVNELLRKDSAVLRREYPQGRPAGEISEEGGDERMMLISRALRDEAFKRGSGDNISIMVVQFKLGKVKSK